MNCAKEIVAAIVLVMLWFSGVIGSGLSVSAACGQEVESNALHNNHLFARPIKLVADARIRAIVVTAVVMAPMPVPFPK